MADMKDEKDWDMVKKEVIFILSKHIPNLQNFKPGFIQSRIRKRMLRWNIDQYKSYLEVLKAEPEEQHAIIQALSIHVTHFFRDKNMYEVFITETIMKLLKEKQKNGQNIIRIWSAGCSSGEEPFSIAMIMMEILQDQIKDFFVDILGTDISPEMILLAKKGSYDEEQLRETPKDYVDKYFDRVTDEKGRTKYSVKHEVRKLVQFQVKDIWDQDNPRGADIIFCRNTMIYFNHELRDRLFIHFHEHLMKEGFLVLGMTETLTPVGHQLFQIENNLYRIYRKKEIPGINAFKQAVEEKKAGT